MHRIFSGDGWFEVLDIRKSAAITAGVSSGATPSHPDYPVHPVHPCSKILFPIGYELLLFHSRMICPARQGCCLSETNPCAWWMKTGSLSSTGIFSIHIVHRMYRIHRIFSGDGWPVFPGIRVASGKAIEFERALAEMDKPLPPKSACDHRQNWRLVQEALILLILFILCIDVQ